MAVSEKDAPAKSGWNIFFPCAILESVSENGNGNGADFMTMKERMESGKLYYCNDAELMKEQMECLELLYDFNQTRPSEGEKRQEILQRFFAELGGGCYIEPPFHANWGRNVHFGNNVYANFNLTLVDDTDIFVCDNVMLGPNVTVATAGHPV